MTDQLPRVSLAQLPTPVEEMKNLRQKLGNCPRLFIKRDDQTGLATGGNKSRKLEYLIGTALEEGADTIITTGGAQSNHCRQTAAAATRHGLRCVLVISGEAVASEQWIGNLLLDDLLGAEMVWAGDRPRNEVIAETAETLRAEGANPYVVPIGGSVPVGATGYVVAVQELIEQFTALNTTIDRIVVVSGSGGTHAGILVGVKGLGLDIRIEGMNNFAIPDIGDRVLEIAFETARYLGLDVKFREDDIVIHDACGEHGYGVITDAEREAIRLMARTEGILLDPVYTARAFGQMVTFIREGVYGPEETLLFWHTGGVAGLFARAADVMSK